MIKILFLSITLLIGFFLFKDVGYEIIISNQSPTFIIMKWRAENGHSLSQHRLGFMYDRGHNVTQNYKQEVYWYS